MIQTGFQPAQQSKPANFYQLPFNEMATTLMGKQAHYDKMEDYANQSIEGLEALQSSVDMWDQQEFSKKINGFQAKIDVLKDKYPDYTDPMFMRELNRTISQEKSDPWYSEAISKKPIYEQWRKAYGESDAPEANKLQAYALMEKAATSPDGATNAFKGQGISTINIAKNSDWGKSMLDLGNSVNASGDDNISIGGMWINGEKWEGIADLEVFTTLGVQFKQDSEGNFINENGTKLAQGESPVVDYINPNLSAPDMEQLQRDAIYMAHNNPDITVEEAFNQLYLTKASSIAEAISYQKVDRDVSSNPYGVKAVDFEYQKKLVDYKDAKETQTIVGQLVYGNQEYGSLPKRIGSVNSADKKLMDIVNDPNSSPKEKLRAQRTLANNGSYVIEEQQGQEAWEKQAAKLSGSKDPVQVRQGQILSEIIEANPQKKNAGITYSDKEYNAILDEAYQNYLGAYQQTEITFNQFTSADEIKKKTAEWMGVVSGSGDNKVVRPGVAAIKSFVIMDENGRSEPMDMAHAAKEMGVSVEELIAQSTIYGHNDGINDINQSGAMGVMQDGDEKIDFMVLNQDYATAKKQEPLYTLSQTMFDPNRLDSDVVNVGSLNMTPEGLSMLGLKPNQQLYSKRVDVFDGTKYVPQVNMWIRTVNGQYFSEDPYMNDSGTNVTLDQFTKVYQQIIK